MKKIKKEMSLKLMENLVISKGNELDKTAFKSIVSELKKKTPTTGECNWCGKSGAGIIYLHSRCEESMIQFVD